jgi:hypothetical protein
MMGEIHTQRKRRKEKAREFKRVQERDGNNREGMHA